MVIGHPGAIGHNVQPLVVLVLKRDPVRVTILHQVFLKWVETMEQLVRMQRGSSLPAATKPNARTMTSYFEYHNNRKNSENAY